MCVFHALKRKNNSYKSERISLMPEVCWAFCWLRFSLLTFFKSHQNHWNVNTFFLFSASGETFTKPHINTLSLSLLRIFKLIFLKNGAASNKKSFHHSFNAVNVDKHIISCKDYICDIIVVCLLCYFGTMKFS